jgi:uncharacterized membrane protein
MNRKELDQLVAHYQLTPTQIERTLALAHARPAPSETSRFAHLTLMLAGVSSLAAGVVFFVAANWSELRIVGRFVLLEALLLAALMLAFWRPPPHSTGRYALLAAFVIAGALLALFGQTYQTGADVYELFLSWAALGLPIIVAGQWSVLWAAWILVLNLALALFCGLRPEGGPFWFLFGGARGASALLLIATLVNIALWGLAEFLRAHVRPVGSIAPRALRRLILTCAVSFATWAGILAIVGSGPYPAQTEGWSVLWVPAILVGFAVYTLRRRTDVFPLALIAASIVLLGVFGIIKSTESGRTGTVGMALLVAGWLIVGSSAAARVITNLLRTWREAEEGA